MRHAPLMFCALILLSPALRATPGDDFMARGKEPSQALGYKIAQLKNRELRSDAEKELGQKFDLRAFHDEVMKNGALPVSILETHLKKWVAKAKKA